MVPQPANERITLALGPTNTGKTHRAIERMLEHDSGMIGLPLRLLAREVYDRITARLGEQQVALVTGEEKRVPRAPRYWVCTVEAMPERAVDFLAVDEIQLAAHRERGHVFTDRLLRARGRLETWFLGADTMASLARELLPEADLRHQPRLSTLRYAGGSGLGGLPPRSAAVCFSADAVYELAARLKARRGGAAVVLGGLSPRTRNAQVALYQAREVQYLVATDAIGMGLNLDIDHVAFAARRKFDGAEHRALEPAELAQIAGRAGRHRRDGTFGTLSPLAAFDERLVRAIEEHRFPRVRRLVWRNHALDFGSLEALIGSLAAPPPDPRLGRVEQADDFDALRALARRAEVRERATDADRLGLLWEVCQVPDYRKLLLLRHVTLLGEIYTQLVDAGRLDPDWIDGHLRRVDRIDGEVDHLTARLAHIRVWTYVTHRGAWVADPAHWQARARAIEDRLGDALHARLVERFVEKRRTTPAAKIEAPAASPFAKLGELLASSVAEEARERSAWIEEVIAASHEALRIDDAGALCFSDRTLGRLRRGRELLAPELHFELDEAGAGARSQLERRLTAFVRDWTAELLEPLRHESDGALRGLLYQLERGLGTVARGEAQPQIEALGPAGRARLADLGIEIGRRAVFSRPMLEREAVRRRALLLRAFGVRVPVPDGGSLVRQKKVSHEDYLRLGYVPLGPRAIRADRVERGLAALRDSDAAAADALAIPEGELAAVVAALGLRRKSDGTYAKRRRRR